MSDIVKAVITKVPIGNIVIDGVMYPDGTFGIAIPQIADLFLDNRNVASRDLKRLLGNDFKTSKIKSELNTNYTNSVDLKTFELIVAKLDRVGNVKAQQFRDDMVGLSLHQLFCDAFDIKFEKDDRRLWLIEREAHRKQFHPCLTKWLQIDGCSDKDYGKQINLFKLNANCPLKPVVSYNTDELQQLNNAEIRYDVLRRTGMAHEEAIKFLR